MELRGTADEEALLQCSQVATESAVKELALSGRSRDL